MRRWLAVFLLVLLPLQFSWAAAASYCQHEQDARTQHVGHHEHQHAASSPPADIGSDDGVADDAGRLSATGNHPDCGYCNFSIAKSFASLSQLPPTPPSHVHVASSARAVESVLFDRIERPDWHRA
jgi:hypothetical protein